jgi:hypothetical protein
MALRIARGMFRLCLVLSVLWIGAVGVVTYSNLPARGLTDQEVGLPAPPPGFVLDQPDNGRWWRAVQTGAEIAIIPPVFILIAGAAFFWAFRGFRSR